MRIAFNYLGTPSHAHKITHTHTHIHTITQANKHTHIHSLCTHSSFWPISPLHSLTICTCRSLQLGDTKSADNKTTLLHYLVETLESKHPDALICFSIKLSCMALLWLAIMAVCVFE